MAKQPKKMTLAEKRLLMKLRSGGRVGVGENTTADKLLAREFIKYVGNNAYILTEIGKASVATQ